MPDYDLARDMQQEVKLAAAEVRAARRNKLHMLAQDAEARSRNTASDQQQAYWNGVAVGLRRAITVLELGL